MSTNEKKWVEEFLLPELLNKGRLIKDYNAENKNSFELKGVFISPVSTAEAFMLTDCYKLMIDFDYKSKHHKTALVVKKTPRISEKLYRAINFNYLFHKEIVAYSEIIPALGCSVKYPKYFYSNIQKLEAVLVLEDFTKVGWRMSKSRVNLSLEHVLLSVKKIGKFHSKGYALKLKEPKKFNNIINKLKESNLITEPPASWYIALKTGSKRITKATQQSKYKNAIPDDFLNNLENYLSDIFLRGKQMLKPKEPFAVLCHGDFSRNNISFKYADQDLEEPIDAMLFDFQTLRYSSPMIDLTTFLANSSGEDVRAKNFDKIFECYCNEIKQNLLKATGMDVKSFPAYLQKDILLREYVKYLPYGIGIASVFLGMLHEPADMTTTDLINQEKTDEQRINDIMERGGERADKELAFLTYELYQLSSKLHIDVFQ